MTQDVDRLLLAQYVRDTKVDILYEGTTGGAGDLLLVWQDEDPHGRAPAARDTTRLRSPRATRSAAGCRTVPTPPGRSLAVGGLSEAGVVFRGGRAAMGRLCVWAVLPRVVAEFRMVWRGGGMLPGLFDVAF